MEMETKSQITKKIIGVIALNILLLLLLYSIPINGFGFDLCIYKHVTGKECLNCGMTRAFLAILHGKFSEALAYNKNVIIVFPYTVLAYLYCTYKYIKNKGEKKNVKHE